MKTDAMRTQRQEERRGAPRAPLARTFLPRRDLILLFAFLAAFTLPLRAQHLNTGALSTNQDSQLIFVNGSEFAAQSGYVAICAYTNGGTYARYYGNGLNPTVEPATVAFGGPISNAPALGSFIQMRIESVTGPPGGAFAFWDAGATSPSVSKVVGDATPSALFALSDRLSGAGAPGSDPYGHIHGRRFTASKSGNYTVGFKLFDTSTNGVTNGPMHKPSEVLTINFATTVALSMKRVDRTNGLSRLTIHQGGITNVFVEASTNYSSNGWTTIAGPFTNAPFGSNSTTTVIDTNSSGPMRFYRLRGVAP